MVNLNEAQNESKVENAIQETLHPDDLWSEFATKTLDVIGKPSWYFTYRRLGAIPMEETINMMRKQKVSITSETNVQEIVSSLESSLQDFIGLVTDWNIQDFDGNIYPIPKDDSNVWKKIPTSISGYIANCIKNDKLNLDEAFLENTEMNMETTNQN